MFYTYVQNNSYGYFKYKENEYSIYTIIEANSVKEAEKKAKEIGIYFNGADKGIDCPCCGDRWHEIYKGTDCPEIYGENAEKYIENHIKNSEFKGLYFDDKPNCIIHYKNGEVKCY